MNPFSPYKALEEVKYIPVSALPWPVREDDVWMVTGVLQQDCLELCYDLIPGFSMKGYRLQSFPLLFCNVTAPELKYNFPGEKLGLGAISEIEFRKAVGTALGLYINPAGGYFIRKHPTEEGFLVMEIVTNTYQKFLKAANRYLFELPDRDGEHGVRFSKRFRDADDVSYLSDSSPELETYGADPETTKLAKDVEEKIATLLMQDFPVEVIETWLKKAVKLSRIKITADYRILLTDYNKEIKMRQLPKALFLWMLRHKDGCRLKDLSDHKTEILDIYNKLTIHDEPEQAEASIGALVNAQGNSFSEKCTAVKYAFLNEIPDRIAKNYYIWGPQAGVKKIHLDRGLVDWEALI